MAYERACSAYGRACSKFAGFLFGALFFLGLTCNDALFAEPTEKIQANYFEALSLLREGKVKDAERAFSYLLSSYGDSMSPAQRASVSNRLDVARQAASASMVEAKMMVQKAASLCSRAGKVIEDAEKAKVFLKQALMFLEKSSKVAQEDLRYNYLLAFSLFHLGKAKQAEKYIDKAQKQLPRNFQCYDLKSRIAQSLGDVKKEYLALRYGKRLRPKNRRINYRLAKVLLARKREEKALEYALKASEGNHEVADELASHFVNPEYREQLLSIAAEIRIKKKRINVFGADDSGSVMLNKSSGGGRRRRGGGGGGGGEREEPRLRGDPGEIDY